MPPTPLRAWGTRFDSLVSDRSTSDSTSDAASTSEDDASTPTTTSDASKAGDAPAPSPSAKEGPIPTPHDASIFVGSLPSNVDEQHLTRLLTRHLADYPEIKGIKVVRDNKGGVCAFLHTDGLDSAAHLLKSLQSAQPKAFLDRTLRFEPTRAQRTLLLSYRAPSITVTEVDRAILVAPQSERHTELRLPTAMRLCRPPEANYIATLYDAEARDLTRFTLSEGSPDTSSNAIKLSGCGVCFDPLQFDANTLQKLATSFGDLEHFGTFAPLPPSMECHGPIYPVPHNAFRASHMEAGCWEVKWEHRDAAVLAYNTLRKIPHLTVTWAHHAHGASGGSPQRRQPGYLNLSPRTTTGHWSCSLPKCTRVTVSNSPTASPTSRGSNYLGASRGDVPAIADALAAAAELSQTPLRMDRARSLTTPRCEESLDYIPTEEHRRRPSFGDADDSIIAKTSPAVDKIVLPICPAPPLCPVVDRSSIFVGGLLMNDHHAWDEAQVRAVFSRYGVIKHIQFVRPFTSQNAFAFVEFQDSRTAANACRMEHNRMYRGRPIRVQLRRIDPRRRGSIRLDPPSARAPVADAPVQEEPVQEPVFPSIDISTDNEAYSDDATEAASTDLSFASPDSTNSVATPTTPFSPAFWSYPYGSPHPYVLPGGYNTYPTPASLYEANGHFQWPGSPPFYAMRPQLCMPPTTPVNDMPQQFNGYPAPFYVSHSPPNEHSRRNSHSTASTVSSGHQSPKQSAAMPGLQVQAQPPLWPSPQYPTQYTAGVLPVVPHTAGPWFAGHVFQPAQHPRPVVHQPLADASNLMQARFDQHKRHGSGHGQGKYAYARQRQQMDGGRGVNQRRG